jgi:hypothetical protein
LGERAVLFGKRTHPLLPALSWVVVGGLVSHDCCCSQQEDAPRPCHFERPKSAPVKKL